MDKLSDTIFNTIFKLGEMLLAGVIILILLHLDIDYTRSLSWVFKGGVVIGLVSIMIRIINSKNVLEEK